MSEEKRERITTTRENEMSERSFNNIFILVYNIYTHIRVYI